MIAETIPEAYDPTGRKVFRPDLKRRGIHPTLPMGRYVSQPLAVKCETAEDIRTFLSGCNPVSDMDQFGKREYWQPPEEFEQTKRGDCDCFALWTWRQFMALGYDVRIVFGQCGRYGTGHAWVEFLSEGKCFLVEPQYARLGQTFPRLSTLSYHPKFSATWDGKKISFYQHEDRHYEPRLTQLIPMAGEWLPFWGWVWLRRLPWLAWKLCRAAIRLARPRRQSQL